MAFITFKVKSWHLKNQVTFLKILEILAFISGKEVLLITFKKAIMCSL